MAHIALFGGAFDPPHLGHQQIVAYLLEQLIADQVWLVPVGRHSFDKQLSPAEHRLAMVELAMSRLEQQYPERADQFRVEHYELDSGQVARTYQTIKALARQYPEHQLSWVIGSDNLAGFERWDNYRQLLTEHPVYVYPRQGYPLHHLLLGMEALDEAPTVRASSQHLRQMAAAGRDITDWVPPLVAEYIDHHGLYRHHSPELGRRDLATAHQR
ncbi:MAG: nicotinate (nicotinamide) nucleotide adenylyltransferase [Candidatus Pacebacteria bacterium CG10_big_fil_rev_8_21_14_0_10_56_10]|nr:MAG: nicotinate (nicotinamide) nucleotide adenylyltransferase [Candidatus Pacebacteria bacterium CG10_big_fil_rev_8_21_14_0_10_56_10]